MAWIKTIPETSADDELREVYRKGRPGRGQVAPIYQVRSVPPPLMTVHLAVVRTSPVT